MANRKSKKYPIVVLSGGWGEPWENDHTQLYARMVAEVLGVAGYNVNLVDCGNKRDLCSQISQTTDEIIAYNCIFGRYGEDGTIAALLEFLQISYTGSGPLASALSMDKARCTAFLSHHEVRVPRTIVLEAKHWSTLDETDVAPLLEQKGLCFSKSERVSKEILIVKPNQSSFGSGVTALSNFDGFRAALRHAGTYSDSALVQEFVEGMTVYVPVLCGKALTPVEVVPVLVEGNLPGCSFRSSRKTYMVPARLDDCSMESLCHIAEVAHTTLGCRGLTRSDFRVAIKGEAYFLELNSQHSIRPNSVALMSAQCSGLSALTLVESILEDRWIPHDNK